MNKRQPRPIEFRDIAEYAPDDPYSANVFLQAAILHLVNMHGWAHPAISILNDARGRINDEWSKEIAV